MWRGSGSWGAGNSFKKFGGGGKILKGGAREGMPERAAASLWSLLLLLYGFGTLFPAGSPFRVSLSASQEHVRL